MYVIKIYKYNVKSLIDYINECLNESILDIDDNVNSDMKEFIIKWINEHNVGSEGDYSINRTKHSITADCISINNNGVDIITPARYKNKLSLRLDGEERIPFKINSLDGFINIWNVKNFDGQNLPNKCAGMSFVRVSKLDWKNATVQLLPRESVSASYGVSFYGSAGALKSVSNIVFNFAKTDSWFTVDNLKPGALKGISFKKLKYISVGNNITASDEELSKIEGVKSVCCDGKEFRVDKGVWK